MRYQVYTTGNKIIVVSHYAGKIVKGVAKCSPADNFSYENGEKLAKLRCDAKIAKKRINRAKKRYQEALDAFNDAHAHHAKMLRYLETSVQDYSRINAELEEFQECL